MVTYMSEYDSSDLVRHLHKIGGLVTEYRLLPRLRNPDFQSLLQYGSSSKNAVSFISNNPTQKRLYIKPFLSG